jgi:hypothetical protein
MSNKKVEGLTFPPKVTRKHLIIREIIMKKYVLMGGVLLFAFALSASFTFAAKPSDKGFNQFGYNYSARIFNGTGSSWCLAKGLPADCQGIYSADKLVMKWNAEWDRGNAENWASPPYYAWENNEWNGMNGGSSEVWHYKIVWVGPCTEGAEFEDGGYCLWGQFEVLSDHGKDSGGHTWNTQAIPNGYGAYRYNQVDSFTVPADSVDGVMSNITLNADSKYLIKVVGQADAGDTINFDAEYSITNRIAGDTWTDDVSGYTSYGPNLLDLMVNGGFVSWGPYNDAHQYFYYMAGNGSQVNLKVNDVYPSNNTGSLGVTIFEQK